MKKLFITIAISLIIAGPVLAVDSSMPTIMNPFDRLQVAIPGMARFTDVSTYSDPGASNKVVMVPWIGEYLIGIYNYAIGIIGIAAVLGVAIGGLLYVLSGGNSGRISKAKSWIYDSLLGLAIALSAYLILSTLNKELVMFRAINVDFIDRSEFAFPDKSDYVGAENQTGDSPISPSDKANIKSITISTINGNKYLQVDQSIVNDTQQAFNELKAIGFDVRAVGGYRSGSSRCHGKGLAFDINVEQNYCVDCYKTKGSKVGQFFRPGQDSRSLTRSAVEILKRHGFCWGGDWISFKDYMHFSKNCTAGECSKPAPYNWNATPEANQRALRISYP